MKPITQITGHKFNRLTVLSYAGKSKSRNYMWLCQCDCGNQKIVSWKSLKTGATGSCGCLRKNSPKIIAHAVAIGKANITHGMSKDPTMKSTWSSWSMMMQRCFNPKRKQFEDYGGRGIKPCTFVAESPRHLVDLIGLRPEGTSIDRPNVNLGYTCGTCPECLENGWPLNLKWSTCMEQGDNKRSTRRVSFGGMLKTCRQIAVETGRGYWETYNHYFRTA